jgi:hypothetical protein
VTAREEISAALSHTLDYATSLPSCHPRVVVEFLAVRLLGGLLHTPSFYGGARCPCMPAPMFNAEYAVGSWLTARTACLASAPSCVTLRTIRSYVGRVIMTP